MQTRKMREDGFIRLTVPRAKARKVCAIRRHDHHRAIPLSQAAPIEGSHLIEELVEPRPHEIDELDGRDGQIAHDRAPNSAANDSGLRQWRILDAAGKLFGK